MGRSHFRIARSVASALFLILALTAHGSASAQERITGDQVFRFVASEFGGVGGYWFTGSSITRAIGTPKFGSDSEFYVRPAHVGSFAITGGIELVGASDHWLPFSGGNSFSLTGASFQIAGEHARVGRLVPFLRAGLFAGNIHSDLRNFDTTSVVPSAAFGAEMKIHRYITISAEYRLSGEVGGYNSDGFIASIHLF